MKLVLVKLESDYRSSLWLGMRKKSMKVWWKQYTCMLHRETCVCENLIHPQNIEKGRIEQWNDNLDHVYLRHLSTECRSILSADMLTDTRSICRPRLGRVLVYINRQACRPTPGRYFTATRPPLSWYFTNTRPTLRSLDQLLLPSSIFSALLREAFSGRRPILDFNSGNIQCLFSSYVFSSSSLLYTTLVTFGCSSIWGLLLFSIDWTLRDMFVWVPSFPTQCSSRSCITYVYEMAAVWPASSLYQHMSIGDGLFFRATCW